jgi:hypothetical protein
LKKDKRYEGEGFFKLCEELGFGNCEELQQKKSFAKNHIADCHVYWGNKDNVLHYKKIN